MVSERHPPLAEVAWQVVVSLMAVGGATEVCSSGLRGRRLPLAGLPGTTAPRAGRPPVLTLLDGEEGGRRNTTKRQ